MKALELKRWCHWCLCRCRCRLFLLLLPTVAVCNCKCHSHRGCAFVAKGCVAKLLLFAFAAFATAAINTLPRLRAWGWAEIVPKITNGYQQGQCWSLGCQYDMLPCFQVCITVTDNISSSACQWLCLKLKQKKWLPTAANSLHSRCITITQQLLWFCFNGYGYGSSGSSWKTLEGMKVNKNSLVRVRVEWRWRWRSMTTVDVEEDCW